MYLILPAEKYIVLQNKRSDWPETKQELSVHTARLTDSESQAPSRRQTGSCIMEDCHRIIWSLIRDLTSLLGIFTTEFLHMS